MSGPGPNFLGPCHPVITASGPARTAPAKVGYFPTSDAELLDIRTQDAPPPAAPLPGHAHGPALGRRARRRPPWDADGPPADLPRGHGRRRRGHRRHPPEHGLGVERPPALPGRSAPPARVDPRPPGHALHLGLLAHDRPG